jgi:hypothetical protein
VIVNANCIRDRRSAVRSIGIVLSHELRIDLC